MSFRAFSPTAAASCKHGLTRNFLNALTYEIAIGDAPATLSFKLRSDQRASVGRPCHALGDISCRRLRRICLSTEFRSRGRAPSSSYSDSGGVCRVVLGKRPGPHLKADLEKNAAQSCRAGDQVFFREPLGR